MCSVRITTYVYLHAHPTRTYLWIMYSRRGNIRRFGLSDRSGDFYTGTARPCNAAAPRTTGNFLSRPCPRERVLNFADVSKVGRPDLNNINRILTCACTWRRFRAVLVPGIPPSLHPAPKKYTFHVHHEPVFHRGDTFREINQSVVLDPKRSE